MFWVVFFNTMCCFLTHGGREDDDPQHVHAFAGTGNDFILDVGSRCDLQEHWVAQFRVVVVGHDINIVGLRLFYISALHYRNQICSVLEWKNKYREFSLCGCWRWINEQYFTSHWCLLFAHLPAEKLLQLDLKGSCSYKRQYTDK